MATASPVPGDCRPARGPPPAAGSHRGAPSPSQTPESSLTWCLSHLSKPAVPEQEEDEDVPGSRSSSSSSRREPDKRSKAAQWRALVAIRTQHIKGRSATSGIARFRTQGGLRPLLSVLRDPRCSRKTLDLALSILGNCCTELATRMQVRKLDGVTIVVDILKRNVTADTVQNRAARALGNLAMDPQNSALIHSSGGVPHLLLCLTQCSSPSSSSPSSPSSGAPPPAPAPPPPPCPQLECAQSAARALLYLADTHGHRLAMLSQGALQALAPLLAPDLPAGLRHAALRAVHELTRSCGVECAREASRSGVLPHLGAMASGGEGDGDGEGEEELLALKALANLCSQGCLRPLVGSLDAVRCFAREARRAPLRAPVFLRALCLCCKEAVNRAKVKESGGLEVLVGFLSSHPGHPLARMAVVACVDFVYDEAALEQLQELGLVPVLIGRLAALARQEEDEGEAEEPAAAAGDKTDDVSSSMSPSELLPSPSSFESFDFPSLEGRRDEARDQAPGSSSFLSLRSWLLSEGLISSEGDLLESPGVGEGDWSALHLPSSSSSPPSSSSSPQAPPTAKSSSLPSPSLASSSSARPSLPPTSLASASTSASTPTSTSSPSQQQLQLSSPGDVPTPTTSSSATANPTPTPGLQPACSSSPSSKFSSPQRKRPRIHPPPPRPALVPPSDAPPSPSPTPGTSTSSTTTSSTTSSTSTPQQQQQQPLQPQRHPYHPEPWAPESPVLLLLSRFSHASDPSGALVTPAALRGLLGYVSRHRDPSSRCLRMLGRLSCNPNCLQALVRTGAPALIRHHLCRPAERGGAGGGRGGASRQTGRVRAKVKQLGLALLTNMRVQCEAAFGSGVLTHAMLSGSEADKLNCAMSLPLICSNKALLKKLLLDHGGLRVALLPLGCRAGEDDEEEEGLWEGQQAEHAADCGRLLPHCFSAPPASPGPGPAQLHALYLSLLIGCLSGLVSGSRADVAKKPLIRSGTFLAGEVGAAAAKDTPPPPPPAAPPPSPLPPPRKKPRLLDRLCPYGDAAFDLVFRLDDGTTLAANREAVSAGSEYFRALLGGGFEEAESGAAGRAIPIGDVRGGALLPVLHYLHGCRLRSAPPPPEEEEEEAGVVGAGGGGGGGGRCQVLGSLVREGLGVGPGGGRGETEPAAEERAFQDSPLGEAMVGARRFLVAELQREGEELCVELLLAHAAAPPPVARPPAARPPHRDHRGRPRGESTDEGLARRASALELGGAEPAGAAEGTSVGSAAHGSSDARADAATTAAVDPDPPPREPKPIPRAASGSKPGGSDKTRPGTKNPRRSLKPAPPPEPSPSSSSPWVLLPQVYWFSQRHSYPALGRACLSVLLGAQRGPRPPPRPAGSSSSSPGACLGRLAREADCTKTLKRDLLDLVTLALS